MIEWLFAVLLGAWLGMAPPTQPAPAAKIALDRVTDAVEGVESSHSRDPLMWRSNLLGPQGPMQVTAAAALDAGGGNRFDPQENRQIGRAYLAALFHRYGNWTEAIAAYYWGPGNLDHWIAAGRPSAELSASVRVYLSRITHELAGVNATAASAAAAPPTTPAPPPPEVKDPALHKAFERNLVAARHLQDFVAGDDSEAGAVLQTISSISNRPGYEEFKPLRGGKPHTPSLAVLREIASVMLGKLQSESAAIVLADERRHDKLR
jgi:hypothetical protein